MLRYFLEFAYKGTYFKGLQAQPKQITIQGEIENALSILTKDNIKTTLSSRTDAGVHAHQNFLHFDTNFILTNSFLYNLNSILHSDIVIRNIYQVNHSAHSRFDATERNYTYHIIQNKNPFLKEIAYYYPFKIDIEKMNQAAYHLLTHKSYQVFSKKHTDVKTFLCSISKAFFETNQQEIIFHISSNRFLRGMVRGIVGTLLQVGRGHISVSQFQEIIQSNDNAHADFSAPALGLFLEKVNYPPQMLSNKIQSIE